MNTNRGEELGAVGTAGPVPTRRVSGPKPRSAQRPWLLTCP